MWWEVRRVLTAVWPRPRPRAAGKSFRAFLCHDGSRVSAPSTFKTLAPGPRPVA